jgi:hypothetical protein
MDKEQEARIYRDFDDSVRMHFPGMAELFIEIWPGALVPVSSCWSRITSVR